MTMPNLLRSLSRSRSRRNSTNTSDPAFTVPIDINSAPIFPEKRTLVVAATTPTFDPIQLQLWKDEGYHVHYCCVTGSGRSATYGVQSIGDELESGQKYAIVAYDHAATVLLEEAFESLPKLCAFVAFYPTKLPDQAMPRNNLNLQLHMAGSQLFSPQYPTYAYPNTEVGFNERFSPSYDRLASGLAWSRALSCIRQGFGLNPNLEGVWERHLDEALVRRDPNAVIQTMTSNPSVLNVPTLAGGVGQQELFRFYAEHFIPGNPPSLKTTLVSRTVGSDKVVDEIFISLRHTQEIPWLLPGVPPTDKVIEVVLVSVVAIRGGRLEWERMYWDQASVLVQAGLLDPKLGAIGLGQNGLDCLPIAGAEAARKVLEGSENGTPFNPFMEGRK